MKILDKSFPHPTGRPPVRNTLCRSVTLGFYPHPNPTSFHQYPLLSFPGVDLDSACGFLGGLFQAERKSRMDPYIHSDCVRLCGHGHLVRRGFLRDGGFILNHTQVMSDNRHDSCATTNATPELTHLAAVHMWLQHGMCPGAGRSFGSLMESGWKNWRGFSRRHRWYMSVRM